MSIISFEEIKAIRYMLKGNNKERSLMLISFFILGIITYITVAVLFAKYDIYSLPPFNLILDTGLVSLEIAKNSLVLLVMLYTLFLLLLIYLILPKICNLIFSQMKYNWNPEKKLSDWEFQGNILVDSKENALHIVQSELGCIIRNRSWRNFMMSFEFKIPDPPILSPQDTEGNGQLRRGFGIIYRAKQLGEYYMIKVDENGYLPHVRNLYWENNGPIFKSNLIKSDLNKWMKVKLKLIDHQLTLSIKNDEFKFIIPTHSTAHKEADFPKSHEDKPQSHPFLPISFRDYGSVGFRSAPLEEVFIKNIEIKEESFAQFIKRKFLNL